VIEAHPLDQIEIVRRDRRFEMLFRVSARFACLREPVAHIDPAPQMVDAPLQNVTSGRNSLRGRGPLRRAAGRDCLLWRTSLRRYCAALPNPKYDGTQNDADTSRAPTHTFSFSRVMIHKDAHKSGLRPTQLPSRPGRTTTVSPTSAVALPAVIPIAQEQS
jgi:hypothetical protein